MARQRKRVKVSIDKKEYTIIGTKSAAHVELVAETLNHQLSELKSISENLSKEEQAILIAVNAVSDQIESHKKMIQLEKDFEKMRNKKTD